MTDEMKDQTENQESIAGASFHGGGLVSDQPTSPHLLIPKMKARLYIGIAANDDQRQPDAKDKLKEACAAASVPAEIEGDVVGPDDEAVARAVDQVRVERRVLGDHVATVDVVGERLTGAQGEQGRGGQRRCDKWAKKLAHGSSPQDAASWRAYKG